MWQTLEKNDVIRRLNTKEREGLTEEEVKIRQTKYGKNKLKDKKKESLIIKFIKQFNDFMIITLIIASIISAVISKMQGENDYVDSIIIIGIVIFNALMGVIQEAKAEKSIEALKQMTPQITKVIRNGKTTEINAEDLVKGDIVILETGNFIPADCRIIESHNLKIEESSLTGEAEPSLKEANIICKKDIPLGDMKNMAFMASTVVNGTGKAIVTETGMETKVGQIANMIIEDEAPETPLQKKLGEVGKILGIACLAICIIIFIIGLIKKIEPIEMFMTAVGLAVAAIPEGLPAIVTIMLSIGVTKMAKKNSIIRKLPAVETLGSSNVICSDKTGTLTQNKMKVVEVKSKNPKFIITMATLCTDCEITVENNQEKVIGEPTEKAIVEEGLHIGCNKKETEKIFQRINEIPFDSNRKMMTTIHRIGSKYRIICKGAPDVLLDKCTKEVLEIGDSQDIKVKTLDKLKIKNENEQMAHKALRVIAVAFKDVTELPSKIDSSTIENNLTFVGLIGMIDPPREGVKEAVKTCKTAGIKTVMITGDHLETAKAIAKDLGILNNGEKAITGQELDKMTQEQLEKNIKEYSVFARVTPEHKVRIVKAWQRNGAVVAMTGDGVNDVLALKDADCSIAMASGSEAAAQASQIVLLESDFSCMPQVVLEGRRVVNNIQRSASLFLVKNIFSFLLSLFSVVFMFTYPLEPSQVSLISMFTIGIPAFFLALEPNKNIIKGHFLTNVFLKALPAALTDALAVGALVVFGKTFGVGEQDISTAATMLLAIVGFMILYKISAPMNKLRAGILGGCIAGLLFCSIYLNQLFAISGMTTKCIMLFVVFAIATEPVLRYLTILLGKGRFYYRRLRGKAPLEEEA